MLSKVLANWTTQFLQHINNNLQSKETERVTVVTNKKNTKNKTEVIDVDSVVPPLRPGNCSCAYLCSMGTESNRQSPSNFDEADDVMRPLSLLFFHWLFDCYCILRSLELLLHTEVP